MKTRLHPRLEAESAMERIAEARFVNPSKASLDLCLVNDALLEMERLGDELESIYYDMLDGFHVTGLDDSRIQSIIDRISKARDMAGEWENEKT